MDARRPRRRCHDRQPTPDVPGLPRPAHDPTSRHGRAVGLVRPGASADGYDLRLPVGGENGYRVRGLSVGEMDARDPFVRVHDSSGLSKASVPSNQTCDRPTRFHGKTPRALALASTQRSDTPRILAMSAVVIIGGCLRLWRWRRGQWCESRRVQAKCLRRCPGIRQACHSAAALPAGPARPRG